MKLSFGSKNDVEHSLTISVSSEEIEKQVKTKLNSAQKSAKIKGFRKGKAPLDVVTRMYEPEIRQDVINDAVDTLNEIISSVEEFKTEVENQ